MNYDASSIRIFECTLAQLSKSTQKWGSKLRPREEGDKEEEEEEGISKRPDLEGWWLNQIVLFMGGLNKFLV